MSVNLINKKWVEFEIKKNFNVSNSVAYHKNNLKDVKSTGISYISRTNYNNGLESVVENKGFKFNTGNTIVFGAENATFFYQPNQFITGNKMYTLQCDKINKYVGLFINTILNSSILNCGFGYGKGLTGSRLKRRFLILPISEEGNIDYPFMEEYAKKIINDKKTKYINFINKRLENFVLNEVEKIEDKTWKEFCINEIFIISSGKRLTKSKMTIGKIPFVGASDSNNGITNFVSNLNSSKDSNILGVNYNGSVVENFYHPYISIFSDDVKKFKLRDHEGNKYIYLFLKQCILMQKNKYRFGYKFNTKRMIKQIILLPANDKGLPDFQFMENYMKKIEFEKISKYLTARI
jgi:hypothetical protein